MYPAFASRKGLIIMHILIQVKILFAHTHIGQPNSEQFASNVVAILSKNQYYKCGQ
jgi:hypothetical protein